MTAGLRIELLGSLSVRLDGQPVEVGPLRQQALLAVLALRANRTCTAEELFDAVWGDKPPATGLKVLPPYIYRIRKALPVDGLLERTRDGYTLRVAPDVVDVNRFDAAVLAAETQQDAAAYVEALDLFRGEPLSGLPGHYLATHRQRLVERRYKVLSDRIDLDLASGRHSAVVAELVTAVAERTLDERLAGQLMLALYAGGRQADAMKVYTRTRDTLVDQLGVEPGPELRATHQRILRNESTPRRVQAGRDELPYQDAAFVGRDKELAAVVAALSPVERSAPPIVAVDGMGGAGKTALAVRAARELAAVYPDGLLYLQLHGHTPGREPLAVQAALDHLLSSIGVKPERIPRELDEQAALWRSEVAGRRVLVVMDDTPSSRLVEPLLPGAPSCGVLITSRRQLTGIDAARRVPLGVLGTDDAARLLVEIVGADRGVQEATRELVERCGYLPLAIRIAGARLRHRPAWTVEHLNQRLQAQDRRLDELSVDGRGLVSTFAMSYEQLSPEQQRMFRYLSLLPGRDVDRYGAAALAGVEPQDAEPLLEDLLDASLLLQSAPDRFQFHDLVRQYASQLSRQHDAEPDRGAATGRLLEYYLQTAHRAVSLLTKIRYITVEERTPVGGPELSTSKDGLAWGDAEAGNVLAAVQQAGESFDELSWLIGAGFARYFHERNQIHQRDTLLELALAAARRDGSGQAQARVLQAMALLGRVQRSPLETLSRIRAALDLLPADGDVVLRIQLLSVLGETLRMVDPGEEAIAAHTAALELAQAIGDRSAAAHAMTERAITEGASGEHRGALESYRLALSMAKADDDRTLQPHLLNGIAESYNELGQPLPAIEAVEEAQTLAAAIGMSHSQTDSLCQLGAAHRLLGDYAQAIELQQQALAIGLETSGVFTIDEARLQLGRSYLAAGQLDESRSHFGAVVESAQEDHRRQVAARGLDGLAACAEASGAPEVAAALLDEALERLGAMTPLHATKLRRRREALARSA